MDHNVSTIVGELEHVSVGVGAIRRLDQISETVHQLRVSLLSCYSDSISNAILYKLTLSAAWWIYVDCCLNRQSGLNGPILLTRKVD